MLSPTTATIRLTLHVLAATIWVGGQFTLAGLLPVLRAHDGLANQPLARSTASPGRRSACSCSRACGTSSI